jgi:uncharacterized protein YaeQ
MALKATIFKAKLQIANMERNYYGDHAVMLARHPSETDERLMVRLLAFCLHADPALSFGKGLSTLEEPDLWLKDLTDEIKLWIDVGQPEDKRVRRACGRADSVTIYSYGTRAGTWWQKTEGALARCDNLTVINLAVSNTQALAAFARPRMDLSCTIQDSQALIADGERSVQMELNTLKKALAVPH